MEIIRGRHDSHFTIIANQVLRDSRLSFRARGVHHYLLSFPSGWRIDSTSIANEGKEGRDAVRAALRELEANGYLHRSTRQDQFGRWRSTWVIHEIPMMIDGDDRMMRQLQRFRNESDLDLTERALSENQPPAPENPASADPRPGISGRIEKKNEKKNESASAIDQQIDSLADEWWRTYKARNGGKAPIGKRAWFALRNAVRAALAGGYAIEEISEALRQCETVPSVPALERALRASGASQRGARASERLRGGSIGRNALSASERHSVGCDECAHSGWQIITADDGYRYANPCSCQTTSEGQQE